MLTLRGVRKSFGEVPVLDGIDLIVPAGSFTVICGPPGNGKSVLARAICGLDAIDAGRVELDGEDVTGRAPGKRDIGYVPQSFALFPHYSVEANIGYPLSVARTNRAETAERVQRVARMLGVEDQLPKRVDQISGGQKQRVALARGLIKRSALYVLDDPLVGLDFKLREQLTEDLRRLQRDLQATFVYLTSDPLEAMALADHVGILSGGRIVETVDMPLAYLDPGHVDTAVALGFPRANRFTASTDAGVAHTGLGDLTLPVGGLAGDVEVVIRPEHIQLEPGPERTHVRAELVLIEDLGGESVVYLRPADQADLVVATVGSDDPVLDQDIDGFWFDPRTVMIFESPSGARMREKVA